MNIIIQANVNLGLHWTFWQYFISKALDKTIINHSKKKTQSTEKLKYYHIIIMLLQQIVFKTHSWFVSNIVNQIKIDSNNKSY